MIAYVLETMNLTTDIRSWPAELAMLSLMLYVQTMILQEVPLTAL